MSQQTMWLIVPSKRNIRCLNLRPHDERRFDYEEITVLINRNMLPINSQNTQKGGLYWYSYGD